MAAQDLTLSARARAAFYGFSTRFRMGLKKAPVFWPAVATQIPSDTETEIHAWLEIIPGMKRWTDERHFHSLGSVDYSLTNGDWDTGFAVPRNKVRDDRIGLYGNNAEMLGEQAAKWPDVQIADRMKNGHTSGVAYKCFDGVSFFNAAHPISVNTQVSGTFRNLRTSFALTEANFNAAYAEMQSIPGPDGQPLGVTPTHLVGPPALRATILEITKAGLIVASSGTASKENVNQGVVEPLIIPELAGADADWYLLALGGVVKPFIFQIREQPGFDEIAGFDSHHCKMEKELLYGTDARGEFGYSFPHFAFKGRG